MKSLSAPEQSSRVLSVSRRVRLPHCGRICPWNDMLIKNSLVSELRRSVPRVASLTVYAPNSWNGSLPPPP